MKYHNSKLARRYRKLKERLRGKERVSKKVIELYKKQPKYDNAEGEF